MSVLRPVERVRDLRSSSYALLARAVWPCSSHTLAKWNWTEGSDWKREGRFKITQCGATSQYSVKTQWHQKFTPYWQHRIYSQWRNKIMLFILLFIDCHKHCILRGANYFMEPKGTRKVVQEAQMEIWHTQQLVLLRIRFAEGPLQVSDRLAVRLLSLQQESQLQVYLTRAREGWS